MPTQIPVNPSNTSDPTTPASMQRPTALGSATNTVMAGTPLAILTIWLVDTYGSAHGQPINLNVEQATAIGGVGAALFGYLSQIVAALTQALLRRFTNP
jgi:hypothetical protein